MPPQVVQVKGIDLTPLKYREVPSDEGVTIYLTTTVSAGVDDQLRPLFYRGEVFTVLRDGGASLQMRFGLPYWSEHSEGIRYHLTLVEDSSRDREAKFNWLHMQEIDKHSLAAVIGRMEALLDTLAAKGVLSQEEFRKLRDPDADRNLRAYHRLNRLEDAHKTWTED